MYKITIAQAQFSFEWASFVSHLPDMELVFFDRFLLVSFAGFIMILTLFHRDRRLAKLRGCQESYRCAPVKDPFIGFDFIYERLLRGSPPKSLRESHQMFGNLGSTYIVSRWTTRTIHTCDSRNVKHLLASSFDEFRLPGVRVSVMSDLLGLGIFTLDGQAWSFMRALLRPSLTKAKMDTLPNILEGHVQSLLRHLQRQGDGVELDIQPLFFKVTMDVASEFLLGRSTNLMRASESDRATTTATEFIDSYMVSSTETVKKMRLGPLSFLRFNPAADRARNKVFAYMDNYIDAALQAQREERSHRERSKPLFLQDLAAAIGNGKTLRDQVLHIFLASRDTTASLLSNLFFILSRDHDMYAKLRGEIIAVASSDSPPTFEQLKSITYLKWCVNESLRLHPVIPSNAREAAQDTTLPCGGGENGEAPLFVRKGTVVFYNVYSMHRDKAVFGEDVEEFRPERWRGLRPGWGYLPFNGGPRVCIGQQFALLETYYIVARLLQTYETMELMMDNSVWEELPALAVTCKNGVHVRMHRTST